MGWGMRCPPCPRRCRSPNQRTVESRGLPAFHTGGQTYRQEAECNLLVQRKARSANGAKLLISSKRERCCPLSASIHQVCAHTHTHTHVFLHTPAHQVLIKKCRKIQYFFILSFQGDLYLHSWNPLPVRSTNISVTFSC